MILFRGSQRVLRRIPPVSKSTQANARGAFKESLRPSLNWGLSDSRRPPPFGPDKALVKGWNPLTRSTNAKHYSSEATFRPPAWTRRRLHPLEGGFLSPHCGSPRTCPSGLISMSSFSISLEMTITRSSAPVGGRRPRTPRSSLVLKTDLSLITLAAPPLPDNGLVHGHISD